MEKVGRFCEFFHLDARVRSRLYELAAEARYTIPVFVGGDMTRYQQYDMDRFALRVADWGDPDEEEWKKIIRKAQASGAPLNSLTREDFEALIAIKSITDSGSNAEVRKKNGHLCVYEVERHKAVG